jgi:hypothetical protein
MMAVYAVQLRQAHGGGGHPHNFKYSNVFYVNEDSALSAANTGLLIWNAMKAAMFEWAYCYSIYATDLVPATTNYAQVPVPSEDQRGLLSYSGTPFVVHPIICARVDLLVNSSRPSRKFVRGGYASDVFNNGGVTFVGTYLTLLQNAFAQILIDTGGSLVDVDGQGVTAPQVLGVTTRELGREAYNDLPTPPAFG